MFGTITWRKATIANGAALSDAVSCMGQKLVAIMQAANTEGVSFGLEASFDAKKNESGVVTGTFVDVYNVIQEATGAAPVTALWEVTKSATLAQFINLPAPFQVQGPAYLKIETQDASNAAVNQNAEAIIWLGFQELDP